MFQWNLLIHALNLSYDIKKHHENHRPFKTQPRTWKSLWWRHIQRYYWLSRNDNKLRQKFNTQPLKLNYFSRYTDFYIHQCGQPQNLFLIHCYCYPFFKGVCVSVCVCVCVKTWLTKVSRKTIIYGLLHVSSVKSMTAMGRSHDSSGYRLHDCSG